VQNLYANGKTRLCIPPTGRKTVKIIFGIEHFFPAVYGNNIYILGSLPFITGLLLDPEKFFAIKK